MNKEKVKRFVKEHKKEIALGAACMVLGVKIGKRKYGLSKEDQAFMNDVYKMANGSRKAWCYLSDIHSEQLRDFEEVISKDGIGNRGINGVVVFTKK